MRWKAWTVGWVLVVLGVAACAQDNAGKDLEKAAKATPAAAPRDAILGAAWSHDGKRIAVSWVRGGRARVFGLFAPDTSGVMPQPSRGLPITSGEGEHATWSPDGLWVAFATDRDGNSEIYRVRPDGTGAEDLTHDPGNDAEPAYSPDGKLIAFTSDRDGGGPRLYVMNADGSDPHAVSDELPGSSQMDPAWSPKGDVVAFATRGTTQDTIYVTRVVGGGWGKIGVGHQPAWSADGGHIFYAQHDSIFARESNGGARGFVVGDARAPAVSPDGRWLSFVRGTGSSTGLYILDLHSMKATRITP